MTLLMFLPEENLELSKQLTDYGLVITKFDKTGFCCYGTVEFYKISSKGGNNF